MKRTASQRKDRRIERTRESLSRAFMKLIVEKGYDRTTIQEVLKQADVGRSTFYAHFYNKQDLLVGRMSVFQLRVDDTDGPSGQAARIPDVSGLFEHVGSHRELYEAIRGTEALEAALAIARADLLKSFQAIFQSRKEKGADVSTDSDFLAQFFTGALLHLLTWWVDAGMPETAATMNRWFQEALEKTMASDH